MILAKEAEIVEERAYCINGLMIADKRIKSKVDIEPVFPLSPDYRHRLYLGKIHVVERKDGEHFRQRSVGVRQCEHYRGFVNLAFGRTNLAGEERIGKNKKNA